MEKSHDNAPLAVEASPKGAAFGTPEQRKDPTGLGSARGWDMGAAGLVAV